MLLDAILPATCPGCGAPGRPICLACESRLGPARGQVRLAGVDAVVAVYAYEGVARELVARVKYRNARAVVPTLADTMVGRLGASLARAPDAVTWPPTTAARRRARGFDAAELLARGVARRLGVPCRRLLVRVAGDAQTGRDAASRRRGPRFDARGAPVTVLLVDDVLTTGATLTAGAVALRRAGTHHITALVAAQTPPPGTRPPAYTPRDEETSTARCRWTSSCGEGTGQSQHH